MSRTAGSPSSWLSPLLEGQETDNGRGRGVYARSPIPRGTLLVVYGGTVLDEQSLDDLPASQRRLVLQIEERHFLWSVDEGPADWVNHSCDPNVGLQGPVCLVSRRHIRCGEEVTYDYCMSDGSSYDEFPCLCGGARCRRTVSSEDWRRPELWRRYQGQFSPYLERRIQSLKANESDTRRANRSAAAPRSRRWLISSSIPT